MGTFVQLDFAINELYVSSERWNRQCIRVAKLHEKVVNQRKNVLRHESKELATHFDVVANMNGMSQAPHFGKSVADNGWGMFISF